MSDVGSLWKKMLMETLVGVDSLHMVAAANVAFCSYGRRCRKQLETATQFAAARLPSQCAAADAIGGDRRRETFRGGSSCTYGPSASTSTGTAAFMPRYPAARTYTLDVSGNGCGRMRRANSRCSSSVYLCVYNDVADSGKPGGAHRSAFWR